MSPLAPLTLLTVTALCAALCMGGCAPEPARNGRLELIAAQRAGDPLALALVPGAGDAPAREALLVEGSQLVRLELGHGGALTERARLAFDLSPLDLACSRERLFVAAGSAGLWAVDLTPDLRPPRPVAEPPGECTAVALAGGRLLAAFTADGRSELWILDEGELAILQRVDLPRGTPFAIAAREDRVWLALGEGGLVRVELDGEGPPRVVRGPDLSNLPVPAGFRLARGLARDLALGDEQLYVAADSAGLVAIDLCDDWGGATPLEVLPVHAPGKAAYALRVAAEGRRVAVGALRGPARAADGAPYGFFGAIGLELEVGGVATEDYPLGDAERLLLFEHGAGGLVRRGLATLPPCGWRTLELDGERVFAMHLLQGLVVRDATRPALPVIAGRRERGLPAVDGGFGLTDPELVVFGVDSEGAITGGLHRILGDGRIEASPGTEDSLARNLTIGAQWLDPERGCEWFLGGGGFSWWLQRLEPGTPPSISHWEVRPPEDLEGQRGHTYFHSAVEGDLLLLTRSHSRFGLLSASTAELTRRALGTAPGGVLELDALHQLETHAEGSAERPLTWRVSLTRTVGDRRLALVAAGAHADPSSSELGRARALVFELPEEERAAPRLVAQLAGAAPRGMALAIEGLRVGERQLALVVGLSGELNVFDVTRPGDARRIATWTAPENPHSGRPEPLLDLAVDERSHTVFLAAGRLGLVRVDLTDPEAPRTVQVLDTPGWCAGVCYDERDGRARLAVGDQKGGLRVYRWIRPGAAEPGADMADK